MKISICSDHAGFLIKSKIVKYFGEKKYNYVDYGTDSLDSVDYPDYVKLVIESIKDNTADIGILVCGSGNGVCMAANRNSFIRACICWNKKLAILAREHNDANVLCIPANFLDEKYLYDIVDCFVNTDFEGGRHLRRIKKIDSLFC